MKKRSSANLESTARKIRPLQSITGQLLAVLVPMITVAIVFIILFLSTQAKKILVNQSTHALQEEIIANAETYSKQINLFVARMDEIVNAVQEHDYQDNQEILDYMKKVSLTVSEDAPDGLYIALEDGTWMHSGGFVPAADYVPQERGWYQEGITRDFFALGDPYLDVITGGMVVTISRKITLKDGRTGVAASDISLASIADAVGKLQPMGIGKTMLLDGNAILAYFDESLNGSTVEEHTDDTFLSIVYEGIDHVGRIEEIQYAGTSYYVDRESVEGTNWILISSVAKKEVLSDLSRFQLISWMITVIVILLVAVVIFWLLSRIVTKPVKQLTENIISITNGDFTVEISEDGHGEISLMNRSMKQFVEHMRLSLGQMQRETIQLSEKANQSRGSSESMNVQAREQSESMEQIRGAMDGMANAVTDLAENATKLAGMVNDLSVVGREADDIMKELVEKAEEGQCDMQKVTSSMGAITVSMEEMNHVVKNVEESASQITGIVEMINSIAEQTSLLSLNASIEAARAGEAGKGFAVVATEIGSLANDSADASKEIGDIIDRIMKQIEALTQQSVSNMQEIDKSAESVAVAGNTFQDIFHDLDLTGESMRKMLVMVGKIDDVATNVAAISEEQSASSEEVTESVNVLAESADQVAEESRLVTENANTVSESADNISQFVAAFKL